MTRRQFLYGAGVAATKAVVPPAQASDAKRPPNIIFIFTDDLGYGDISPYGSRIDTPNLARMAEEGVKLNHFYASPVCSTSRAALLTGRYGVRSGVPGVLQPWDRYGMSMSETTVADMLKARGYRTMCVGKWHLGLGQYLPTRRGFDDYYGIPYSNDQDPSILMHGTQIVEQPVDQDTITKRYTQTSINFIEESKDQPFFLYLAHTFPHSPPAASRQFQGKSGLGLYGDSVMEIDWSTGQIFETLRNLGLDENTLVIFSSDNGPWFQGRPGSLRGRKGDTFEGGVRVPFLARFPGVLPKGKTIDSMASTLDMLPTFAGLAGAALPDNPLDGVDILPVLSGATESVPRPLYLYFHEWDLQCARMGKWKIHVARGNAASYGPTPAVGRMNLRLMFPELYDMELDPDESYNVAQENQRVVRDMQSRINAMLPSLPAQVQASWKATMARPVDPNKDGEWPTMADTDSGVPPMSNEKP